MGVKWILGGECGHMWRVIHQYMDTMNGPADFLEEPVSPITGTRFANARSTKMVHICGVFRRPHKKRQIHSRPVPERQVQHHVPRFVQPGPRDGAFRGAPLYPEERRNHFYEMPENTIREKTFCCGSGAGLGADENMEMRLRGGLRGQTRSNTYMSATA